MSLILSYILQSYGNKNSMLLAKTKPRQNKDKTKNLLSKTSLIRFCREVVKFSLEHTVSELKGTCTEMSLNSMDPSIQKRTRAGKIARQAESVLSHKPYNLIPPQNCIKHSDLMACICNPVIPIVSQETDTGKLLGAC